MIQAALHDATFISVLSGNTHHQLYYTVYVLIYNPLRSQFIGKLESMKLGNFWDFTDNGTRTCCWYLLPYKQQLTVKWYSDDLFFPVLLNPVNYSIV